jgi:hypothetical protein
MKTASLFLKRVSWMIWTISIVCASILQATPLRPGMLTSGSAWYSPSPSVWLYAPEGGEPCSFDKTPPSIVLNDDLESPSCTQLNTLPWSTFISVTDNCTPTNALIINYKDSTDQNCSGYGSIFVYRTWTVYDRAGNKSKMVQLIKTNRVELKKIKFPDHVNAFCPAAQNLSVDFTGVPTYNGEPVDHYCGLTIDYKDFNTKVCGNSISIRRHWTVTDCCTLYALNFDQNINYLDTSKPAIVCPAPLSYGTNVKECYSHQIIPSIAATDDCNPLSLVIKVVVDGQETYIPGQRVILSKGTHTFEYHVSDLCGNESVCSVPVTVFDGQGPLLVCKPIDVCLVTDSVRVGPNGMVSEYWDDCSGLTGVTLRIRKLEDHCGDPNDDLVFKDSVTICCSGNDKVVLVEIEARDAGGNVSYCVTEVRVTSKIPLVISCQDSVHISCGIPIPDNAPKINYCGDYTVTSKIVFDNRNGSGVGIVIKRYIVKTSNDQIDSCQTVFTVGLGSDAFGVDDVICPAGTVTVQGCSIPDLSGIPGISLKDTARPCALVTVTLKIDTFNNLGSPCLRVKRTWTVKDAKQPALNVVCVQNIDIIDTDKPVLSGVKDTTVFASLSCNRVVDLPPLKAKDCDPNVTITNSLNAQGADIGPVTFPKGMTSIKYKATDKCGNKDSLTIKVTVIDTSGFRIICQNDTIVACGTTFVPKAAQVIASCTQVATNVLKSDTIRNKCSIVKINFKRIISDTLGRKDSCTFMVTFRAADTLFCDQIQWPKDTILNNCNKSISPDSLKLKPVFTYIQGACSMVITKFKDSTVAANGAGGCTNTTLRLWTVQDTCSIPPVTCTHIQSISVIDNTPPVLKVPKDTMVFLTAAQCDTVMRCDTLLTFLGSATATDCDPNVSIKSVVLGKTDTGGASLVRRYGVGTTSVLVIAKDACGNISRDTLNVIVKDTIKPCASCKKSNNYLSDQGTITIHARQFNGGSHDNCSPASQLRFSWTKNPNDTLLVVNCFTLKFIHAGGDIFVDSVRVFPFERNFNLYVTDANGNQDTCKGNRFLAFFDTLNICGKNAIRNTAAINGKVVMPNGKAIPNVLLSAIGDDQYQKTTDISGDYSFNNINPGVYKMFPYKNDDPTLGVSTADLIAIQRHILGIESFNQMGQYIAADINKDTEVSTIDLVELRKLILGVYSQFPQNTSWRFFDQTLMGRTHDHTTLVEFENPFVQTIEKQTSQQNFTGIKIGDVNGSGIPQWNLLSSRSKTTSNLFIPDLKFNTGEIREVPISIDMSDLSGMQASIQFEGSEIIGINESYPAHELVCNEAIFSKGTLNISWIKAQQDTRTGIQALLSVFIRPKFKGVLSGITRLNEIKISAEAYTPSRETNPLLLEFTKASGDDKMMDKMVLWQNAPNPFNQTTTIKYTIPSQGKVNWQVTDVTGRIVDSWTKVIAKGDHTIELDKSILGTTGIYYYRMEYNGYSEVKKLILLE